LGGRERRVRCGYEGRTMSEYPASLGDLADVEARIDARLSRLEKRQDGDAEVTDEKFTEIRSRLVEEMTRVERVEGVIIELADRVKELERLWVVARENPELVRELAAQALKGRGLG
jgi:putative component of toxin-antitoxin plasmid stabilization module